MKHTFKKKERLKSAKVIDRLFVRGKRIKKFPLAVIFDRQEDARYALQAAFSVPKKNFKKSVERNRIKRLMREAYRLQKALLQKKYPETGESYALMFIYLGKKLPGYKEIETAVAYLLNQVKKQIEQGEFNNFVPPESENQNE